MSQLPVFIEILANNGDLRERIKLNHLPVTLGRAYDNDVILDDNFVAAHHARLERNQLDELILIDQGSHNGIYLNNQRLDSAVVDPQRALTLGRTQVRIRTSDTPVAPEQINAASYRYTLWPWALGMLVLLGLLSLFKDWLYTPEPADFTDYLVSAFSMPLAALAGGGLMALIGKLFYGQARFILQLTLTSFFGLVAMLIEALGHILGYSLNLPSLLVAAAVLSVGVSALSAYVQFRAMGNQRRWLLGVIFAGLALAGLIFKASGNYQASHYPTGQIYMGIVLPEWARLSGVRAPAEFVEAAAQLQADADARREPKDQD